MIPQHKFKFVDLGDLLTVASANENANMPEFSTDIIGVLEDFEHVRPIDTVYDRKNIVRFRITDGRNSHKVTVWGDLSGKTESSYNACTETPIIVVLTSTKLKIYKNTVQISTLPSSKVYLNLKNDTVLSMCRRLEEEGYTISQSTTGPPTETVVQKVIEMLSLKQLSERCETEKVKKIFLCNVKVQKVEDSEWWYNSCSDCEGEIEKIEGKFKCSKCPNKTVPIPEIRYRIVILAEDCSEAYNFILMDRAAKRLIGTTSTKLQLDMFKSGSSTHPKIKDLNGKEVKLKIQLSEDNVKSGSHIFYATDAFESDSSTSATTQASMNPGISDFTETNAVQKTDCEVTPGSAKSVTKPRSINKKIKTEK